MQVCNFCEIAFCCVRCPLCEEREAVNAALKERDELREKVDSMGAEIDTWQNGAVGLKRFL